MSEESKLRQNIELIAPQLRLTEPVQLADDLLHFLVLAGADIFDPAFAAAVPFTVARFKECAQKEIYEFAKKQSGIHALFYEELEDKIYRTSGPYVKNTLQNFMHDMALINRAYFGRPGGSGRIEIGRFKKQISPHLHIDRNVKLKALNLAYLSRVGMLPVDFPKSADRPLHEELICEAVKLQLLMRENRASSEEILQVEMLNREITEKNILAPVLLGDIVLYIATGKPQKQESDEQNIATPHRSSPILSPGEASAFFRYFSI